MGNLVSTSRRNPSDDFLSQEMSHHTDDTGEEYIGNHQDPEIGLLEDVDLGDAKQEDEGNLYHLANPLANQNDVNASEETCDIFWPTVYVLSIGWAVISTMHGFYNLFVPDADVEKGQWLDDLLSDNTLAPWAILFAICSGILNYYIAKNNVPKTFKSSCCAKQEAVEETKEDEEALAYVPVEPIEENKCTTYSTVVCGTILGICAGLMNAVVNIDDNEGVADAIAKNNQWVFGICMILALASTIVTASTRVNGGIALIDTFVDEEKRREFFDVSTTQKIMHMIVTLLLVVCVAPVFWIKTDDFISDYMFENMNGLMRSLLCTLGMVGNMGFYFNSIRQLPNRLNKFFEAADTIMRDFTILASVRFMIGAALVMSLISGFSIGDLANTIVEKDQLSSLGWFGSIVGAHGDGATYGSPITLAAHLSVMIINFGATIEIWADEMLSSKQSAPELLIDHVFHPIADASQKATGCLRHALFGSPSRDDTHALVPGVDQNPLLT